MFLFRCVQDVAVQILRLYLTVLTTFQLPVEWLWPQCAALGLGK